MARGEGMFELDRTTGKWFDAANPATFPKKEGDVEKITPEIKPAEAHHVPAGGHHAPSGGGYGGGDNTAELMKLIYELQAKLDAPRLIQEERSINPGALTQSTRLSNITGGKKPSSRRTYLTPTGA